MKTISNILSSGLLLFGLVGTVQSQQLELNLEQAIEMAKEKNKELLIQHFENNLAEQTVRESKGYLLPTLSAGGSYSYFFDRAVIFMPGSFVGSESPVVDVAVGGRNAMVAALNLNQPLISEVARRQVKSNKLGELVEQERSKDMESRLRLEVSRTYYDVLLLDETILLYRQSLERNLRALKDAKQLLEQGKGLKIDTVRNSIVVENLKTDIAYLQSMHQIALMQFGNKLGISGQQDLVLTDRLTPDYTNAAIVGEEISNRPDVQQQKWLLELSKNGVKVAQAQRLPSLSLFGSYQLQAQADDMKVSNYEWPTTTFVGLQVSVPLFNGNRVNAKSTQAHLRLQQSAAALQDLEEKASIEVLTIQVGLQGAKDRADMHERTMHSAQLNYDMVEQRYHEGLSSRLELSDAELALSQARMNVLKSVYEVNITQLELKKAIGML